MGLEAIRKFLKRNSRIALDSNIFIYQFEENIRYQPLTHLVFEALEHGEISAVTSTITVTELLVPAYRAQDGARVDELYGLLATHPLLEWVAPDLEIADLAAELRTGYNLRTPDALQAATAIQRTATGFLTNDLQFERLGHFETLVLDRIL